MGASDSKLVFKKGIFRLSEERHIPASDAYWASVGFPLVHLLITYSCTLLSRTRLTIKPPPVLGAA